MTTAVTTATGDVLLRTSGLHAGHGRTEVIRDVDFELRDGEVVAVLGPNGAGKSTLLAVLAGLIRPAAGTVDRRGRVALALQASHLARRTARANVELSLAWWGVPRSQRRARAMEGLRRLRADHLAERPARNLSGGEQRRVHLARFVAALPDVLLLDEPFAGLDAETRESLVDDTAALLRSSARSSLVVVHDRAEAWAVADRLVVLVQGRVAAQGPPEDVFVRPPSAAVARFLGYTGELRQGGEVVLARPAQVRLDPAGPYTGTVTRLTRLEDGERAQLRLDGGRLSTVAAPGQLHVGDDVRLRIDGELRFPDTEGGSSL